MSRAVAESNNAAELPALWLYRMLAGPHPFAIDAARVNPALA
jgi:hypothetical protein